MRPRWILAFMLLFVAGCSGLHTGASPAFDWSRVEKISVQGPWEKYRELQTPTLQEVAAMGYGVVPPSSPEADARLELEVVEALDINEVGAVFSRPKSLHVRIYDADSGAPVALADYYLSSTQSAVDGVQELFAGVRKERVSSKGGNKSTAAAPENAPPANEPPAQAEVPEKSSAPASALPQKQPAQAASGTVKKAEEEVPQAAQEKSQETATEAVKGAPPPATQEQETETSEWNPDETKKRSPWIPRLESWGFEDWGKPREGDGLEEMMK
ncbi:MAG: hypothetical protein SV239_13035 [Thermodesulfobacteriota bacterium]|nr:hypothetical protein [Thermodesulfobacteriota bacterium]